MRKLKFKVKTIEIEIGKLQLHPTSNRERKFARIKYLVANMDLDGLGHFAIWRDGHNLYIIDGQHRKLALEELGFGDWKVRCDVYEGVSFEDACDLFLTLNNQMVVAPFDKFDKAAKAGHFIEVETKKIIEAAGFRVHPQAKDGHFVAVMAAKAAFNLDQGEALQRSLEWTRGAWGHTASAVEGPIIMGLALVAARYNGEIDDPSFVKKMAKYQGGTPSLLGYARNQRQHRGGTVALNVAQAVVDVYNKGKGSRKLSPL